MSTRDDLLTIRDAVLAGSDWLDTMLALDAGQRGKRFIAARMALMRHVPNRGTHVLLAEHFAGATAEQIAAFIERVARDLPSVAPVLPTWPTLNLPMEDAA